MQDLLHAALEQVALEGSGGCTLDQLWQLLDTELGTCGLPNLTASVQHALWQTLLQQETDLVIYSPRSAAGVAGPAAAATDSQLERANLADIQSCADAAHQGVLLVASSQLRVVALGLYDDHLARHQILDKSVQALEIIGKARRVGVLQSELGSSLGMRGNLFFPVIKALEARNLIVKNSVCIRASGQVLGTSTHILHLRRFAPELESGQKFMTRRGQEGAGSSTFALHDDALILRRACTALADAPGNMMLESALKVSMGLVRTKGHREWRRLKPKLMKAGYVEELLAVVDGKPRSCIRLLKPWDGEQAAAEAEEEEEELEYDGAPGGAASFGEQVAELPLEEQALRMVARAGPQGIASVDLGRALRFNVKVFGRRLRAMADRHGLVETDHLRGKCITRHWVAPPELVRCYAERPAGALAAPGNAAAPPPTGGYLPALCAIIAQAGDINPLEAGHGAFAAAPQLLSAAAHGAAAAGADGIANHDSEMPQPSAQAAELEPEGGPPAAPQVPGPPAAPGPPVIVSIPAAQREPRSNALMQARLTRLVERLQRDSFVLRCTLRRWFKETDVSDGYGVCYTDRKTIERVLDLGVAAGLLSRMTMTVQGGHKSAHAVRSMHLVTRPGLVLDAALRAQAAQAYRYFCSQCQGMNAKQERLLNLRSSGKVAPEFPDASVPPSKRRRGGQAEAADIEPRGGQAAAFRTMYDNGWIAARMVRVRLLHYFLCRLVGLGSYSAEGSVSPAPAASTEASSPPATQRGRVVAAGSAGQEAQAVAVAAGATPQYLLRVEDMWRNMGMDLFCQVIGSKSKDERLLEWCRDHALIGQLPPEDRARIADELARERLGALLSFMTRMRLVTRALMAGADAASEEYNSLRSASADNAAYVINPVGVLEQPQEGTDDKETAPGAPVLRREFDLHEGSQLDNYWSEMEFMFFRKTANRHCFPASVAPEICSSHAWNTMRLMSVAQWHALRAILDAEMGTVTAQRCMQIARELGLGYDQVLRHKYERTRRSNAERLQSGLPKLPPLASLRQPRAPPSPPPPGRKRKPKRPRQPPSGSAAAPFKPQSTAWESDDEAGPQPQASGPGGDSEAEDLPGGTEVLTAEEAAEARLAALPERLHPAARKKKHMRWLREEDLAVLEAYVRWCATNGVTTDHCARQTEWRNGLPVTNRQAFVRLMQLCTYPGTAAQMAEVEAEAQQVYQRAAERRFQAAAAALVAKRKYKKRYMLHANDPGALAMRMRRLAAGVAAAALPPEDSDSIYKRSIAPERPVDKQPQEPAPEEPAEEPGEPAAEEVPEGALFFEADEADEASRTRLEALMEDVLDNASRRKAAPERPRLKRSLAAELKRAQAELKRAQALEARAAHREVQRLKREARRAGSVDGDAELDDESASLEGGTAGASVLEGRSLLQQWRQAIKLPGRHLALPDAQLPSPPVAAAMELIKSLLYLEDAAAREGSSASVGDGSAAALAARFTEAEIADAFAHLRKAGAINAAGVRRLQLSDRFRTAMQVMELPSIIFEQAAAARSALLAQFAGPLIAFEQDVGRSAVPVLVPGAAEEVAVTSMDLDAAAAEAGPGSGLASNAGAQGLLVRHDDDVPSGLVAEALAMVASGTLELRLRNVSLAPAEPDEAQLPQLGAERLADQFTGPLDISFDVELVPTQRLGRQQHGGGHPPADLPQGPGQSSAAPDQADGCPEQQHGELEAARGLAAAACAQLAVSMPRAGISAGDAAPSGGNLEYWEARAVSTLERVGRSGCTMEQLSTSFAEAVSTTAGGSSEDAQGAAPAGAGDSQRVEQQPTQQSLPAALTAATAVAALFCLRGTAVQVPGYDRQLYVASQHAQPYSLRPCPGQPGSEREGQATPADLGRSGQEAAQPVSLPDAAPAEAAASGPVAMDTEAPEQRSDGAAAARADSPEAEQPLPGKAGSLLRPWLDHRGRLNRPFWRAITRRAMALVIRNPGIEEEVLVSQLDAVTPANARHLIATLVARGLLHVRTLRARAPGPPAFFRRPHQAVPCKEKVFYSPDVLNCMSGAAEVQPL